MLGAFLGITFTLVSKAYPQWLMCRICQTVSDVSDYINIFQLNTMQHIGITVTWNVIKQITSIIYVFLGNGGTLNKRKSGQKISLDCLGSQNHHLLILNDNLNVIFCHVKNGLMWC